MRLCAAQGIALAGQPALDPISKERGLRCGFAQPLMSAKLAQATAEFDVTQANGPRAEE
jgi:hypothetical protein